MLALLAIGAMAAGAGLTNLQKGAIGADSEYAQKPPATPKRFRWPRTFPTPSAMPQSRRGQAS